MPLLWFLSLEKSTFRMKVPINDTLWYCLVVACTGMSLYQISDLVNDWTERPIETIEDVIPKQEIPFPAVTVCHEGKTYLKSLEQSKLKYTGVRRQTPDAI